jgi:hypothetical protein
MGWARGLDSSPGEQGEENSKKVSLCLKDTILRNLDLIVVAVGNAANRHGLSPTAGPSRLSLNQSASRARSAAAGHSTAAPSVDWSEMARSSF